MSDAGQEPRYEHLAGGRADGVFGADDALGCLNRLTPERVAAAATLVITGQVFSLNAPITWPGPPLYSRQAPRHEVFVTPRGNLDDYLDSFYPQASSQWDGFLHVRDPETGWYNGAGEADLGVEVWAGRGLAGRGVLLDVARYLAAEGRPLDWRRRDIITTADLDGCREAQGVALRPGDILLIRTGWQTGYDSIDAAARQQMGGSNPVAPGLDCSSAMAGWLWDHGVSTVAADNPALEASPTDPHERLHTKLLNHLGVPIGELWWLDALAAACADDRRFDFLLVSAPLNVPGGVGSPANAVALR